MQSSSQGADAPARNEDEAMNASVVSSRPAVAIRWMIQRDLPLVLEIELAETDPAKAKAAAEEMARKLLANTVIESFRVSLDA